MIRKSLPTALFCLFLTFNLSAQQNFSIAKYFVTNPNVGAAIDFNQPEDMLKVENYVKSLIETGNFDFPDIYAANLTPNAPELATYPDSVLWNVYYAYTAFSIYIDFSNRVPWRLSDLSQEYVYDFFDVEKMIDFYLSSFGIYSTPTNPVFTYQFLLNNIIIGKTRNETIERLIQWSRYKLVHRTSFFGTESEDLINTWQYNGWPPVERVITGTSYINTGEFGHYIRGCGGAATFYRNVLRIINIPVLPKSIGSHVAINFPTEHFTMLHGDDIYATIDELNDVEIPRNEVLISDTELDSIKMDGFIGDEIVRYTGGKLYAKFFPLTWLYRPDDTTYTYTNYSSLIQSYTRSDTTAQYREIMQQARARYSSVDVAKYNEISNLYYTDTLWYKKVYGLKTAASIDTVLIPYRMGAAVISDDTITFFLDDTANYINPIFIHAENSRLSIPDGSIINLSEQDSIVVMAEDSINYYTYFFKKQDIPQHNISLNVYPENTGTASGTGVYDYGAIAYVKATPAIGFQFDNWTENDNVVSLDTIYSFTVTQNRTLIANFKIQTFTILAEPNIPEGGTISGSGVYNIGATAELTAIPASGYTFINWSENGVVVSTDATYSFTVDCDRNLIANFGLTHYITANTNPIEGGIVTGTGEYGNGSYAQLFAIPSTGYNFAKWTEEGSVGWEWEYADNNFYVDRDRSFVANFEKQSFSIYAEPNISVWGTITGTGWYDYGESAELIAIPAAGYKFVNWTEDGVEVSTNSTYTFIVENTRNNLFANFEQQTYTVSASTNPENAGTINGTGTYNSGSTAELSVVPSIGYVFVNWTENGTEISTNQTYSFTTEADRNLVANFVLQSFSITTSANPAEGGNITGEGNYDYNTTVELTATPNTGYSFVNWTENGTEVSTNQLCSFTAEADRNLVANFVLQSFSITTSANPAEGGNITGEGNYDYNTTVELTATPNTGYSFVNWTENGTEVSTNQLYNFTAEADRNLIANFTIVNSIHNINKENYKLLLFPNPTKDILTIQIIENKELENRLFISLIDATGKTVQFDFKNYADGKFEVSVADLPAGLYLVDVKKNNKTIGKGRVLIIK